MHVGAAACTFKKSYRTLFIKTHPHKMYRLNICTSQKCSDCIINNKLIVTKSFTLSIILDNNKKKAAELTEDSMLTEGPPVAEVLLPGATRSTGVMLT